MRAISNRYWFFLVAVAIFGLANAPDRAVAADLTQTAFIATHPAGTDLICDDGQSYRLQARAISEDGDLVTGYLLRDRNGGRHYLRLVPMGVGYRYAGVGIWLDGQHERASLNFGFSRAADCQLRPL